jgi:hypothetical protein
MALGGAQGVTGYVLLTLRLYGVLCMGFEGETFLHFQFTIERPIYEHSAPK